MKRLDRYVLREMVVPFLIGQGAVVLMLTGTVLYNNAQAFLDYGIDARGVLKIAFYFAPYLIHLTMPVAVAIASALTVSRLARDTEITVMRSAGVSLTRIFLPVFFAGLLLSVGDFFFGERVVPWANAQYEATMRDLSRSIRFLVPQEKQFVQSPDRKKTVYIGRIEFQGQRGNRARLYNVMIVVTGAPGDSPAITLAETADYNDGVWTLHDARTHLYTQGGLKETFLRSGSARVDFRLPDRVMTTLFLQLPLYSSAATRSFAELGRDIAGQRKLGWVNKRDLLEYHFKLSVPFSCLVFALACPPLALRFARAGGFMGVLLSIILVFIYWNTLLAAKIIGAKYPDTIPPLAAAWGQNALFSAIGLFVLWRSE